MRIRKVGAILALIVLFSMLSVSVAPVRAGSLTAYYIDVHRSASEVSLLLNSTTWTTYTPNVTAVVSIGTNETRIYFASEKDLARFLIPTDLKTAPIFDLNSIRVSEPLTVLHVHYHSPSNGGRYIVKIENMSRIVQVWATAKMYNGGGSVYIRDLSGSNLVGNGEFKQIVKTGYQVYVSDEAGDFKFPDYDVWLVFLGDVQYDIATLTSGPTATTYHLQLATNKVIFYVKDALTGQELSNVTVMEGNKTLGVVNYGDALDITKGQHTLTIERKGYWSETVTIDVQQDTNVSVELYPDTAAFKITAPASITTFENTITEVTFTISPIKTEATHNAYLSLSGLTDVLEVKEGDNKLSKDAGKYYLGDISGPTQITVKFRASGQGTKAFTFTVTSQDVLGTKTYTTAKQIVYKVQPLPFQVQLPSAWQVGENTVRINEASGQQVLITLSLIENGTELWTDSYSFGPYEGHSFTVKIPAEGTYTLKASWSGYTATWTIKVNPAISIVQDTITVKEGDIGTVQVLIKNPTDSTQYYTITLEGGFIEGNVTKAVAVAPQSEKTIDLAFSVPKKLQFDAYDLTLKVLQGSAISYQGTVHVIIDDSGGLSLPLPAGSSTNTLLLIGAAGAGLAVLGLAVKRKRR